MAEQGGKHLGLGGGIGVDLLHKPPPVDQKDARGKARSQHARNPARIVVEIEDP